MNKRNCKREYLLRGICHCGKCNSLLSGRKGSHHLYYACSQMQERFAGLESICKSKYTRADALEAFVWNYLFEAWEDKSRFENALYEAQRGGNQ